MTKTTAIYAQLTPYERAEWADRLADAATAARRAVTHRAAALADAQRDEQAWKDATAVYQAKAATAGTGEERAENQERARRAAGYTARFAGKAEAAAARFRSALALAADIAAEAADAAQQWQASFTAAAR